MQRVLLVGPSTREKITDTRWVTAPLGCHHVASWLNKHGHYTKVWDINIDELSFEETVKKEDWNIIAFSTQEATEEYDLAKIHLVKKLKPKVLLIAGGTGASLNYQMYFNKSPLDIVIQAEGEYPLLQLCNYLDTMTVDDVPFKRIPGVILRNYAMVLTPEQYYEIRKDLDMQAMRATDYWKSTALLYDNPNYDEINTFRLYTTNFCPMNCSFCTLTRLRKYACGKHTSVVSLSADQCIEMIFKVLEAYPTTRQIFFVDDDFFILKQRGIDFCNKVIQLRKENKIPEHLHFMCLTNINRVSEDNIDLIKKAGFRVLSIGVESTDQHVLDSLDKKQTVEKIWSTTELILSHGIKPYYTLILFSPDCQVSDLITDLEGFRKLGSMGVGLSVEPFFIPLKGTRLSEEGSPERIREVKIEGTNESIYKGFAWLPKNEDVSKVFKRFEEVYPKYRKIMLDSNKGKHSEKNWQAYVILDVLEYVLMEMNYLFLRKNNVRQYIEQINSMPNIVVDTVGSVTEEK